jgi:hypothetical protein
MAMPPALPTDMGVMGMACSRQWQARVGAAAQRVHVHRHGRATAGAVGARRPVVGVHRQGFAGNAELYVELGGSCQRACVGNGPVVHEVGECAACGVSLVLGVQQVQQAALADVELLAVGVSRTLNGRRVATLCVQLHRQFGGVVEGDHGVLASVSAGLVARIHGLAHGLLLLPNAGAVGTAVEQVPVQQQFHRCIGFAVFHPAQVFAASHAGAGAHLRLQRRAAGRMAGASSTHAFNASSNGSTAAQCLLDGVVCTTGQAAAQQFNGAHVGSRRLAHDALVARRHVMQV